MHSHSPTLGPVSVSAQSQLNVSSVKYKYEHVSALSIPCIPNLYCPLPIHTQTANLTPISLGLPSLSSAADIPERRPRLAIVNSILARNSSRKLGQFARDAAHGSLFCDIGHFAALLASKL